jgi:hypothetical protein
MTHQDSSYGGQFDGKQPKLSCEYKLLAYSPLERCEKMVDMASKLVELNPKAKGWETSKIDFK